MSWRSFDYLLAVASGVLLALSFPKFGHPAVGWIALAPLLVALADGSPGTNAFPIASQSRISGPRPHAFFLGLVTGIVYFTGTLYWITHVMAVYGGLSRWVAVLINALLIAYLALFPAAFAVVVRRTLASYGPPALMAAPAVWVATELGRTYLLTGFPWVLLGYSQASVLPIAQLASLFGVYGVSMLVAAVSAVLTLFAVSRRLLPASVVFSIVLVVAAWGSWRAARSDWTREGERSASA